MSETTLLHALCSVFFLFDSIAQKVPYVAVWLEVLVDVGGKRAHQGPSKPLYSPFFSYIIAGNDKINPRYRPSSKSLEF